MAGGEARQGYDPQQLIDTFVAPPKVASELGYIQGAKPGVSVSYRQNAEVEAYTE